MQNYTDKFSGLLHFINYFNSPDRVLSKSIQTRRREAAHKNSNLDPELSSYHPVTNLRFMSEVVERVVFEQINLYLESNNLRCRYQSAFRCLHSTETASLKVFIVFCVIWTGRFP